MCFKIRDVPEHHFPEPDSCCARFQRSRLLLGLFPLGLALLEARYEVLDPVRLLLVHNSRLHEAAPTQKQSRAVQSSHLQQPALVQFRDIQIPQNSTQSATNSARIVPLSRQRHFHIIGKTMGWLLTKLAVAFTALHCTHAAADSTTANGA